MLELGQVLKVDVTLHIAGVRQDVEVTSDGPLLDVKQNAAGGIITREIIDRIPKERDYTSVVTSLPGVDFEQLNRGIQIDGGSGADNRFFVDGNDRTNLYPASLFFSRAGPSRPSRSISSAGPGQAKRLRPRVPIVTRRHRQHDHEVWQQCVARQCWWAYTRMPCRERFVPRCN